MELSAKYNPSEVEDKWHAYWLENKFFHSEPAVSYTDLLKIQEILSGRTGKFTHVKYNEKCPLTKYVICAEDATPFTSYTAKKHLKTRVQEIQYYKCNKPGCRTNVSAKEMHEKYEHHLFRYQLTEEMVADFSDMIEDMMESVVGDLTEEQTNLKRQMSIVEKDIKTVKMRLATGEIPADVYSEAIVELNNRRDVLQLNLERVKMNLSNQK